MPEYTPTERRLLGILSDGGNHTHDELMAVLNDPEMPELNNLQVHLSNLRKKLSGVGQDVVCVLRGYQRNYRQVRKLTPADRLE